MTSIEFFHIYTNESLDEEKMTSINEYKKLLSTFKSSFNTCILIDDYTPRVNNSLEILTSKESLYTYLKSIGLNNISLYYESELEFVAREVIKEFHHRDKKRYEQLISDRGYIPCSLFVISWYLLRLGYYKEFFSPLLISGDEIINILPIRYKQIDDIVMSVLKRSKKFNITLNKIHSIYFESTNNFRPKT